MMGEVPVSLLLGGVVGVVLALTGAGGGILAVPLLVFGLHMSMVQAAPVGLIAVGLASAVGAALGMREGLVRYRAAAIIGVTGMAFAPLGVQLAHWLPNAPLTLAFSGVLAWVAVRNFRQRRAPLVAAPQPESSVTVCRLDLKSGRLRLVSRCVLALAGTGAVSGLLSGLLGVGGGFVIVPVMGTISNVPARGIVATSLAVIALVSVGGAAAAASRGAVDWSVALPFAAGAAVALVVGRQLGAHMAGARLQQAFALTAGAVAILLSFKGFGALDL